MCRCDAAKLDPAGISRHCNPLDCPYAKGFYDRSGNAVCDALSAQSGFTRTSILEIAERYHICPYEFQLELSLFCDIVVCDYNYVFDPHVYLRRYFDPEPQAENRYAFLIDEAHNLGDRACDMYSATLENAVVTELWKKLPETEKNLRDRLEKLAITLHALRRICRDTLQKGSDGIERGYDLSRNPPEQLNKTVAETHTAVEGWLRTHRGAPHEADVHGFSVALRHYLTVADYYDDRFLTFVEVEGDARRVRLICLDPSRILDALLARARASVLFSATLTPLDYFSDILGGGKNAVRVSLPSPFDPNNLCLVTVPSISTRYEDRDGSHRKIAAMIAATVSGKRGNYIVYFPSYQYMEAVLRIFSERYPKVCTVVQTRSMSAVAREKFLDSFLDDGRLRVGFCVLGGSFSEGVDLPGGRLIGTVIVGTGLPAISNERNILRDHYENTRERGYDYAYTYPGMNRVLQAAGRVIRREDDRGVIVLIDDRYAEDRCKMLFPDHWQGEQYARNPNELAEIVTEFWKRFEKNG
jgi:Rad3-related DNA helicase